MYKFPQIRSTPVYAQFSALPSPPNDVSHWEWCTGLMHISSTSQPSEWQVSGNLESVYKYPQKKPQRAPEPYFPLGACELFITLFFLFNSKLDKLMTASLCLSSRCDHIEFSDATRVGQYGTGQNPVTHYVSSSWNETLITSFDCLKVVNLVCKFDSVSHGASCQKARTRSAKRSQVVGLSYFCCVG